MQLLTYHLGRMEKRIGRAIMKKVLSQEKKTKLFNRKWGRKEKKTKKRKSTEQKKEKKENKWCKSNHSPAAADQWQPVTNWWLSLRNSPIVLLLSILCGICFSLETFEARLGRALTIMIFLKMSLFVAGELDFKVSFQLKIFYDSTSLWPISIICPGYVSFQSLTHPQPTK